MTDPKTGFTDNAYKNPPIVPPTHRVDEPSTWGGFAAIVLGGIFAKNAPELATPEFIGGLFAVASGIFAVLKREKKG